MYKNLLKQILSPLFPYTFFPIFSHFSPSPNPNFSVSWGEMGLDPPPNFIIDFVYYRYNNILFIAEMVTTQREIGWIWDSTFGMYCLFSNIF